MKLLGDEIFERVNEESDNKRKLDDRELMQLIIVPLTYKRKEDKQNAIERVINLLDNIDDERQRVYQRTLQGTCSNPEVHPNMLQLLQKCHFRLCWNFRRTCKLNAK